MRLWVALGRTNTKNLSLAFLQVSRTTKSLYSRRSPSLEDLFYKSGHNLAAEGWRRWRWRVGNHGLVLAVDGEVGGVADAFLGSKLNYWVVLAALTFGNEPLNLEEERRRRSKLHFRGGNRACFARARLLSARGRLPSDPSINPVIHRSQNRELCYRNCRIKEKDFIKQSSLTVSIDGNVE